MDKYKEYLAVNVLNESKVISYRLLSRAVKVHSNAAKQMLFDFHTTQNAKKPGSIHATYIVTGTKRKSGTSTNGTNTQDVDGDSLMRSSPFQSSLPEQADRETDEDVKVTSISLTREEDLEDAKSQYEQISSIHIYSLEPGPVKDLQVLSDCNRRVHCEFATEDPLELWKIYGVIHNPNARRRTNKRPLPAAAPAPVATTAAAKTAPKPSTPSIAKPKVKEEAKPAKASESAETSRSATPQVDAAAIPNKKAAAKAPSISREGSNIFKSFAKAKPKKKEPTPPAQSAEASAAEDEAMKDISDDEGENEIVFESAKTTTKLASEDTRKAKAEREAKLREMMEESDDEPMTDAPTAPAVEPEEPEEPEEVAEEAALDKKPEPPKEEKKETVTVEGGRRRGRRRVMKKKTVKDEDGYLVTKEEPVWESFSEDEPAPKKAKLPAPSTAAKGKKGGAPKAGQGNIMSFFAKK